VRLVIVSNRLPFTIKEEMGRFTFKPSAGGLVSGLSAYLDSLRGSSITRKPYLWIGWPGTYLKKEHREEIKKVAYSEYLAYPIFIPEKSMDQFYHGFCNKTIWPLFHYFPSYVVYEEGYWDQYKKVNELFCDAMTEVLKPGDAVWVHDYHLMLLPGLLRNRFSDIPIGFFLHIPFPAYDIFSLLPGKWRYEILYGLLGADLIGFHTFEYTQHFLNCVLRILGLEHNMGAIEVEGRSVKVDAFPMGIDFKRYNKSSSSKSVKAQMLDLKKNLGSLKTIMSIDRLDYSKGVVNRLRGYEVFLEKHPEWHGKVVLLLVVVPSRVGVEHYQLMKRQIDELVGKINGRFGSIQWVPIIYQYRHLPLEPLTAIYNVSDIALITPLRDGMNLVCKEYVASRADKKGVLILSETCGAARELLEAIIINPNHEEEVADAILKGLEMNEEEQRKRMDAMQSRLKLYDVNQWAGTFIHVLNQVKKDQKIFPNRILGDTVRKRMVQAFSNAKSRAIFLDYDGTLAPFSPAPRFAGPDAETMEILEALSKDEKNVVVIVSGRDKGTLDEWFGSLKVNLVAEHGAWIKEEGKEWKLIRPLVKSWKNGIRRILDIYSHRLQGSFVEEKEYSIAWHYREANPESASAVVKELIDYLVYFTSNIDVQIIRGSKVVEVRCASVDKGIAAVYFLSLKPFDFTMAIGDDYTDEDLFRALPQKSWTIKVGTGKTVARYNLKNFMEVRELLHSMVRQ